MLWHRTTCVVHSRDRRYPIGAELREDGLCHFRVWAPKAKGVEVVLVSEATGVVRNSDHALTAEDNGYFSGAIAARAGSLYHFRLDNNEQLLPDPASRYQPRGPHGPSCIVDPTTFRWTDAKWKGITLAGKVIYEMHVGTFTKQGSWRAAAEQLAELARIGIGVIEMMPVAEFPGEFGWGYDGVDLFAPMHVYGEPDDLRAFVDRAHSVGVAVILDVVYNHFGPEGNYLRMFSDDYLTDRYENDWGDSINFDGSNADAVRELFITNGRYWIEEFHMDGFRFDAVQSIFDASEEYIVAAIGKVARAAAGDRSIILLAENERQEGKNLRACSEGGDGLDAAWNDDFHHSAIVALTGKREAYYTDYLGSPQEFISAAKYGYLFQGQHYAWQEDRRGTPSLGIGSQAFVSFIENHDQVANSATGGRVRLATSDGCYRAMYALLLLGPWTPFLFQGQEFGASTPFIYFCDVGREFREAVRAGRIEFLMQFPSIAKPEVRDCIPVPWDRQVFESCKLDFSEREGNGAFYRFNCDLLRLRREDSRFSEQRFGGVDGAVLGARAFVLRYFGEDNSDRLLIVNFGARLHLDSAPEPLLAPPLGSRWENLWSSDAKAYGGPGEAPVETDAGWNIPAEATVALHPVKRESK